MSSKIKNDLESLVNKNSKVNIIGWQEYKKQDPNWAQTTVHMYKEFKNNPKFRSEVLKTCRSSITDRVFREEQYIKLCDYILDETSLCINGVKYNDFKYNTFVYPKTDSVLYFLEELKQGSRFPKLKEKIYKEKTSVIILK